MKIYYVCECCDLVYKVTELGHTAARDGIDDLTLPVPGDIMREEPGPAGGLVPGLCDDCREEIYGPNDAFALPYRLH